MLDVKSIRNDFPALKQMRAGVPVAYLDSAATALKPKPVIERITKYYTENGSNIHRSVHKLGQDATDDYEATREKVAKFLNAKSEKEIVFTRGTTDAINIIAFSWGKANLKAGDNVVISEMEHHANLIPWQRITTETGATLKYIPVDKETGLIGNADIENAVDDNTKMVSITAMSNVTGVIVDVKKVAEIAHKHGAKILVDAAQSAAHTKLDVQNIDCDFLVFSGHKVCGPTGVGVLYGKHALLEETDPFIFGGSMIVKVTKEKATFLGAPEKFEGGTPNIAGVIALSAALDYVEDIGLKNIHEYEQHLLKLAIDRIKPIDMVRLYGTEDVTKRGGILSFNVGETHPHDTGSIADSMGVAIRVGHHCCQPLMRAWDLGGVARASFYMYNTEEEVERLALSIEKVKEEFGGF